MHGAHSTVASRLKFPYVYRNLQNRRRGDLTSTGYPKKMPAISSNRKGRCMVRIRPWLPGSSFPTFTETYKTGAGAISLLQDIRRKCRQSAVIEKGDAWCAFDRGFQAQVSLRLQKLTKQAQGRSHFYRISEENAGNQQ